MMTTTPTTSLTMTTSMAKTPNNIINNDNRYDNNNADEIVLGEWGPSLTWWAVSPEGQTGGALITGDTGCHGTPVLTGFAAYPAACRQVAL